MDEFEQRWLAFVRRFADGVDRSSAQALVAEVLERRPPRRAGRRAERPAATDVPEADRVDAEMALVAASGELDAFGYWWHNQDRPWDLCGCRRGAAALRDPRLEGAAAPVALLRPVVLLERPPRPDQRGGQPARPLPVRGASRGPAHAARGAHACRSRPSPSSRCGASACSRRTTWTAWSTRRSSTYLADLSRLRGRLLPRGLRAWTPPSSTRWRRTPRGGGRSGTAATTSAPTRMLARDLVGWDVIDGYDELLLANDSCYLVQPFDRVFARMDATACDWWGLQATYEEFDEFAHERLGRPLAVDEVEEQMRRLDLWRYSDFVHVGSYFVAYRKRVIDDPEFRRPARRRGRAERQDDDHPQVRDRLLAAADPRRPPPRDVRRRDPALPPGLPGVGLRPDARRLPAAQAPVPLREPLLPTRPAALEGAGAGGRPRGRRRRHGAQPAPRGTGLEDGAAASPSRSRPDGTVETPQGIGPDVFDDEDRWTPTHPHWWVFPVDPRTGVLSGRGPRDPRGGGRRPLDPQGRPDRAPPGEGVGRSGSPSCPARAVPARCTPARRVRLRHRGAPQRRQPPVVGAPPPVRPDRLARRPRAAADGAHRPLGRP